MIKIRLKTYPGRGKTGSILLSGILCALFSGCTFHPPVYGLKPEYPEVLYGGPEPQLQYAKVDSLTPELRWEAFPRASDREADTAGMLDRVTEVTYDLRVWRAEYNHPFEVLYSLDGLPEPRYRIAKPLQPSTGYIWTVRARFTLEGRTRVTEWGMSAYPRFAGDPPPRRSGRIPSRNYYRFVTPPE